MFGHHDDQSAQKQQDESNNIPEESIHGALTAEPASADESQPTEETALVASPSVTPTDPEPASDPEQDWQHPGTPLPDNSKISDVVSPAGGFPRSTGSQVAAHRDSPSNSGSSDDDLVDNTDGELVDIRQHALTELSPLLDELDQPPEEKFRTIMMVIQASDDQSKIKLAYEAAKGITDEHVRAQALLDIVNEINYFTQPPEEV